MATFDEMCSFLELAYKSRSVIVPCLVGPPGIGKTAAIRATMSKLAPNNKLVVINAQRCIPSEVTSMTMPDERTRRMVLYNSEQLMCLEDGDGLLLDELLEAHQNVLAVLLTLIESRIMPDGTPLPDIFIVAATNATVQPSQLAVNIRQRFVFKSFDIDSHGTWYYINKRFGIDLKQDVMGQLRSEGNEYNVLTPRSLTKMVQWIDESDTPSATAAMVDSVWGKSIGTSIYEAICARESKRKSPDYQVKQAIKDFIGEDTWANNMFEDMSLFDIYKCLQDLPGWDVLEEYLSKLDLKEDDVEVSNDINF